MTRYLLKSSCLAVAALIASPALAQNEAPAQESAQQEPVEGEILVTAQFKEQAINDVPIAMSAYDDKFMRETNIDDMWGVLKFTPGFAGVSDGTWLNTISVRGIRTNDFGVGGDSSVGLFKDGVYQGRTGGAVTSFYDMERAEALRGPQGFLYGRNTISGAVNAITNKPNPDKIEAFGQLTVGERNLYETEAMLNVPLANGWAARVAGYFVTEDGFITNHFDPGGDKIGGYRNAAVRASLGYEDGKTSFRLIAEYERRRSDGAIYRATNDANILTRLGFSEYPTGRDVNTDEPGWDRAEIFSASMLVDVDLDWATLSSVSGFRWHKWDYAEDDDATPLQFYTWLQNQEVRNYSQDLRLVSKGDSPLSWIVGISGYKETLTAGAGSHSDEDTVCRAYYSMTCFQRFGFQTVPEGLVEFADIEGSYRGFGAFASLTYAATSRLELDAGLRYSNDQKRFGLGVRPFASALGPFLNFSYFSHGLYYDTKSWAGLTPRLAVRYKPTDDITLWSSVTRGYKSGGFSSFTLELPTMEELGWTPAQIAACPWGVYCVLNPDGSVPAGTKPQAFAPESVWSYEVGIKGNIGRKIQFDFNGFYYQYKDMQLKYWDSAEYNVVVDNVGRVQGYGVEGSIKVQPLHGLTLQGAGSLIHTRVTDVPTRICMCEGNRLAQQPKVVLTGFVSYTVPAGEGSVTLSADARYQSRIFGTIDNLAPNSYAGHTDLSARLSYASNAGWTAAVYVENLLDKVYYGGGTDGGYPFPQLVFGISPPRTVGAIISYRFGN